MEKTLPKKFIVIAIFLCISQFGFSQPKDSDEIIRQMKKEIEDFFIANGEIDNENKLSVAAYDITDGSDIGIKHQSIYMIRTVYRTDGTDYLFFKNGKNYEIVGFNDLQQLLEKTIALFENESDEKLLQYTKAIIKWYEETYLFRKNRGLRIVSPKTN